MELFRLFGTIAINNNEANSAIDETTGIADGAENRMGSAFKKIGAAVAAAFAVDRIVAFGRSIVDAAATVAAEQSAFEQIMGDYVDSASAKVGEIADATGMVESRLTPYMTSMTAKFKGLGYDIDDATTLAQGGLTLAADAAAFWDKSLEDSMGALNSFINGSYEGGEAIGLFANDTQMAQYAIQKGLVDSTAAWSSLDEATKQATRLEYAQAMFEQSGATGQAAKEADQYANVQANLTEKWRQFKAQIGEPLLQNVVLPAMEKLSAAVDVASQKFQVLQKWVSENKGLLAGIATVIGIVTTALGIQAVAQGVKAAMNATETTTLAGLIAAKWADAAATMAALAPYLLIAAAIAALIAVIVLLVKNWDKVKEVAANVWKSIKETWSSVAEWFNTTVIQPIVNFFTGLWNSITEIWNSITTAVSTAWDTIINVIQVAFMFIGQIISAAFQIITLPFRFIWENCKEYVFAAFEWIKEKISTALNKIRDTIKTVWNAIYTVLKPILDKIKSIISTVWNAIETAITTVVDSIKTVVTTVFNAVKNTVTTIFNAVKNTVSNIWNGIKTTISSVVNAVKTTVSNVFDSIKTAISTPLNAAKSTVSSIFENIKSKISTTIESARDTVKNAIEKIKGFFNFTWSFPKLKLPHFSISGKFSLNPPSVPTFGIEWYKNGGIITQPTLFGYNPKTGAARVGGEAGDEAVAPIDTLLGYVKTAVQEENGGLLDVLGRILDILAEYLPGIPEIAKLQLVTDTGALVGQLAPQMDSRLGDISELRKRGN